MENNSNVIEVHNVEKKFKIYFDKSYTLKERLILGKSKRYDERIVLQDISFNIKKGETIGIIGHNGCGKSTLLKLLTRIIYPDKGTINVCGRVSSLIELGAGFHNDMSGRENIYINAAMFGLTRKEIEEKIDDVIRFSELEEYIDNPVRTYSSGMYMRLAFSVAINVNADILLIDEILAVGDVNFQQKCFEKLKEIKKSGTAIVIVSHSMEQIEEICDRSIWINGGKLVADGKCEDVHGQYILHMKDEQQERLRREQEVIEIERKKQVELARETIEHYTKKIREDTDIYEIDMNTLFVEKATLDSEDEIETLGEAGCAFYGPYIELEEGEYIVYLVIEGKRGKTSGVIELAQNNKLLKRQRFVKSGVEMIKFKTAQINNFEIRIMVDEGCVMKCKKIGIQKK